MHMAKCKICNHVNKKEIEEAYLSGVSPYQIETDFPGVSHQAVYTHTKLFQLDKKRDNSTLAIVNMLIDRGNAGKIQVTPAVFMDALKLRAKLLGEIVDKHEVKEVLDELSNEQLAAIAEQSRLAIEQRAIDSADQGDGEAQIPS